MVHDGLKTINVWGKHNKHIKNSPETSNGMSMKLTPSQLINIYGDGLVTTYTETKCVKFHYAT